jgi:hypothetical protein
MIDIVQRLLITFLIPLGAIGSDTMTINGNTEPTPQEEVVVQSTAVNQQDSVVEQKSRGQVVREGLTRTKKPKATNAFWEKVAVCETNSNWKNGGRWAGGLGIYQQTWDGFGGREFAKTPAKATKEQQIIVANRISTQGYQTKSSFLTYEDRKHNRPHFRRAVGFGGWGCYKDKATGKYRMEKPVLYFYDNPEIVPLASFTMNERSILVRDLQTWLKIKVDGKYGRETRKAHLRWLRKHKLPTDGVPAKLNR